MLRAARQKRPATGSAQVAGVSRPPPEGFQAPIFPTRRNYAAGASTRPSSEQPRKGQGDEMVAASRGLISKVVSTSCESEGQDTDGRVCAREINCCYLAVFGKAAGRPLAPYIVT